MVNAVLQPADLLRELSAFGLRHGMTLMVHASLRRLGPVAGGADGVLDAILASIGPEGTLLMPLGAEEDAPFDARTTPAEKEIGVLAEVFRRRRGTQVNDHVAGRFGALGPRASSLLNPVPLHDYYASGSVLSRFTENDGYVLRLGADPDTVTLTHWAEYLAQMPAKRRVRRRYLRADRGELWVESLDDCNGVFEWAGGDYFAQILLDFLAAGRACIGRIGRCQAELFSAQDFIPFAVDWLEAHAHEVGGRSPPTPRGWSDEPSHE